MVWWPQTYPWFIVVGLLTTGFEFRRAVNLYIWPKIDDGQFFGKKAREKGFPWWLRRYSSPQEIILQDIAVLIEDPNVPEHELGMEFYERHVKLMRHPIRDIANGALERNVDLRSTTDRGVRLESIYDKFP